MSSVNLMAVLTVLLWQPVLAQSNPPMPPAEASPTAAAPAPAPPADSEYPRAAADPDSIARGHQIFSVNCAFCHGSNARGGEGGGPNLLRSPLVMNDQHGEVLQAFIAVGRPERGMPKFQLPAAGVADIAAYLHTFDIKAEMAADFNPKSVLIGNASAGKALFKGRGGCTACHSTRGDLAGIGAKYDPQHLQDLIFTGGGTGRFGEPSPTAPPVRVRATLTSGAVLEGRLLELDDFFLVLLDESGTRVTVRRDAKGPAVQLDDPLQAHRDQVRRWEDRDLHDLTAYLASLK